MKATPYKTIKDLVFDIIQRTKGSTDCEAVTEAVRQHFPNSQWKASHWSFYRSQITSEKGRYKDVFPEEIRVNLRKTAYPRGRPSDDTVKRIGDKILENARFGIELAAGDDIQMRFRLRRCVYQRLLQQEIREKRPVKQALWDSGIKACQGCGEQFHTIKGVEIHRKDGAAPYSVENCELLCRKCHQRKT